METALDRLLAQIAETSLARLTQETIAAQQDRVAALTGATAAETAAERFVRAQQDRVAALTGATAAETAAERFVKAQQDRLGLTGVTAPELAAQRFALDALAPLTRRLVDADAQYVDAVTQRMGALQVRLFEGISTAQFVDVLERDDAVDQLVASPELQAEVQTFVESPEVRELVEHIDSSDLSEADVDEVVEHTTAVVVRQYRADQLSAGEIGTIFTAIDLLVIAAVAAVYGYDVGIVADVLAWPLAAMGAYSFYSQLNGQRPD